MTNESSLQIIKSWALTGMLVLFTQITEQTYHANSNTLIDSISRTVATCQGQSNKDWTIRAIRPTQLRNSGAINICGLVKGWLVMSSVGWHQAWVREGEHGGQPE
jgi:hypothetical protein